MWLHVNNCCKGAVACLYQEGGTTGIMFCHETGRPITGWDFTVCKLRMKGLRIKDPRSDCIVVSKVTCLTALFFSLIVRERVE